jgi:hypothetical protein
MSRHTQLPACYVSFLAEGKTYFLFNLTQIAIYVCINLFFLIQKIDPDVARHHRHPAWPGPKVQSLKNKAAILHQELFLSDASKPKYGQIQDSILANIKKGLWAPGDRVPPERKLAEIFGTALDL